MAEKTIVEKSTGYVLGGVSPLGQKKRLLTIVDSSAQNFSTIFVSAGRRGLDIELRPDDLYPGHGVTTENRNYCTLVRIQTHNIRP